MQALPSGAAETLLKSVGLPTADLRSSPVALQVICKGDVLVAIVGVEMRSNVGLLRSLAVAVPYQGQGLGTRLVIQAETWARQQQLKALYLLTQSATSFFERLGYQVISRREAPPEIATTSQFQSLYPASATLMHKSLISH